MKMDFFKSPVSLILSAFPLSTNNYAILDFVNQTLFEARSSYDQT